MGGSLPKYDLIQRKRQQARHDQNSRTIPRTKVDQAAFQAARPYLSRLAPDKVGAILVPVRLALYAPYRGVSFGMTWPEAAKSMLHVFPGLSMRSRPLPVQQPTSEDVPLNIPVGEATGSLGYLF